jgi:murein DD-endopeptidase MepM/ murein hydrolase activator NlpD
VQHRATPRTTGRHRRTETRPRHRAASPAIGPALLGEHGRSTMMAAVLAAGIGVVGISTVTSPAAGHVIGNTRLHSAAQNSTAQTNAAQTDAAQPNAAETNAAPSATQTGPTPTQPAASQAAGTTAAGNTVPGTATTGFVSDDDTEPLAVNPRAVEGVRVARKDRPVRPRPVVTATWVNPMPAGAVTSCFGERWGRLHAGVDLATAAGTPIVAAGAGVVGAAGPAVGYGNAVLIDHGNGFLTHYGHMSAITVVVGRHVAAGEQVGNEGSTGHSTGPHLHFEVHQGHYKNPIEPTRWMHEHGVDIPGCVSLDG